MPRVLATVALSASLIFIAAVPAAAAGRPAGPRALQASPSAAGVKLTWRASRTPGVSGYRIYRRAARAGWVLVGRGGRSLRRLRDTRVAPATRYGYRVTAVARPRRRSARISALESSGSSTVTTSTTSTACAPGSAYSKLVAGTAGVAGYWRLGEGSGSVACDSLGSNAGSYRGSVTLAGAGALAREADTAAGFDGSTAQVTVPDSASLRFGDSFTAEAWVKRGATGGTANQVIVSKQNGSWALMFNTDDELVLRRSNHHYVAHSSVRLTDTSGWHHVAATKNGASVHLYLDGRDVTGWVNNQTMTDNTLPLAIGQSSNLAFYNGSIDEVAVYTSALTQSQIAARYDAGTGARAPSGCAPGSPYSNLVAAGAGLAGYWRLGEASGPVACDSAGSNPGAYEGVALGGTGPLAGDPDTSAAFNGATSRVTVPDSASLRFGDSFSAEAWVKRGTTGGTANQVIVSKQNGSWVLMFNTSSELVLRRSNFGDIAYSSVTVTDTGSWHHVAVTKSGPSVHLYLDGRDVTGWVSNQTLTDNTLPLAIGQSSNLAFLNGSIDEVAVYTSALTPAQVADHYRAGTEAPAGDPVIAAAGDIACAPDSGVFNGGFGTEVACRQRATSDILLQSALDGVLTLGDNQYEDGTYEEYLAAYDPTWGRVKSITHPVAGNHEYYTPGAAGYFDYFNGKGAETGPAGDRDEGWYSYDIGAWHIIALNSECGDVGGCFVGSPQEQWLKADLAANSAKCTLAYWHRPLWNSGYVGVAWEVQPFWRALHAAGADVILNGHAHSYERFAPQDPDGVVDRERGIREFIVGTGGKDFQALSNRANNSQAVQNDTFGVLEMTLRPTGYDWKFVPEAGKTFTDAGSASCH